MRKRKFMKDDYVILVSEDGIRSGKIGLAQKVLRLASFLWIAFSSVFFFSRFRRQGGWFVELYRLKLVNTELNERIVDLDRTIDELRRHFQALNHYDRFRKFDMGRVVSAPEGSTPGLSLSMKDYNRAKPVLVNIAKNLSLINDEIELRTNSLGTILKLTSLDEGKTVKLARNDTSSKIIQNVRRLSLLENRLNSAPLMVPMDDYRLSSGYGLRRDPFSREIKVHSGVDLVGPYKSNILAPARGVVVAVRSSSELGNIIVLDHGNGVTTAYGHLDRSYVRVGDHVNRGDIIANQGNTGKHSTGSHLHYQVSINKISQDPDNFIRAGKLLDVGVSAGGKSRKSGVVLQ
ncbi:MAG: M23 family metallopeptidase [Rickettsiales bacterium]|nr:M23 family metallopeptidase [Rickettsiales bacterium]